MELTLEERKRFHIAMDVDEALDVCKELDGSRFLIIPFGAESDCERFFITDADVDNNIIIIRDAMRKGAWGMVHVFRARLTKQCQIAISFF